MADKVDILISSLEKIPSHSGQNKALNLIVQNFEASYLNDFYSALILNIEVILKEEMPDFNNIEKLLPYLNILIYDSISSQLEIDTIIRLDYIIQQIKLKYPTLTFTI